MQVAYFSWPFMPILSWPLTLAMTKMALFDAQNGSFSAHMWLYLEILLNRFYGDCTTFKSFMLCAGIFYAYRSGEPVCDPTIGQRAKKRMSINSDKMDIRAM